ncbi:MAG TPA: RtcB family protein, partial [Thermoanaerobaculales bacterium]|nr:RtcB family protein [Thermoanaerobaculales bacterium]
MVDLKDLRRISDHEWEIPTSVRADMRVPVRVFASRALLEAIGGESSLEQAVNAATLPGVVGRVLVMPDVHQGYGFPIGGVAATELPHGVISPGAIGYDINCGVRLLASNVRFADVEGAIGDLASALDAACPSGVGTGGRLKLDDRELERVCREGGEWARRRGYGTESDVARTEEGGVLAGADFAKVGRRARDRGRTQVGTLGAGNHFIEVEVVDEVFDVDAARAMGLEEGFLTVLIHCGSRGFGHQVCTDYVKSFQGAVERYHIRLPDRELVCAPNDSPEGQDYLAAMRCAANYAFANRQVLAHHARGAFTEALRGRTREPHLHQVYDIAHNMGKTEEHAFDGVRRRVCVHRKGATRAFGPGFPDLPPEYRAIGQPVLVPARTHDAVPMLPGTNTGTEGSSERSLASC